ncbi:MAG: HAMP domain-containing protein [Phycisphaerales bacterium]|nr:HAMP domain-containing protein [Phycisphaerales bacterium]
MLRKKLLARLGLLVVGFVTGAVVSIALLQGVLRDLDRMNADASSLIDGVQALSSRIVEVDGPGLTDADLAAMAAEVKQLGSHHLLASHGAGAAAYERLLGHVETLRSAGGADGGNDLTGLRREVAEVGMVSRRYVAAEQASLSRRLRWLVVGLTIAALVMVNITIVVLLRTANMILRPVGELVEGSRELAQERFGYRVRIDQDDEFAELAHAYNTLAGQLEANEQRKVQAMRQLAVTLNHELLNVINSIDLQLRVVDRRSGSDPSLATHLRQIHENLGRIADTIASLRHVRRIVLTDYLPGEKMLDLPRSVAEEEQLPEPSGAPPS